MLSRITVAICCYGLFLPELRTEEEIAGLEEYFDGCAQYIAELFHEDRLSGVVLCGGRTNPAQPDLSEAETSMGYLLAKLDDLNVPIHAENFIVCLEEGSHNTPQNIVFTCRLLMAHRSPFTFTESINADKARIPKMIMERRRWHDLSHNVMFVCDRYRHIKVWVMLRLASSLLPGFNLRVKSFPRKDIHPNSSYPKQLAAACSYILNPSRFFDELKVGQEN